jgi:hypothetical protein
MNVLIQNSAQDMTSVVVETLKVVLNMLDASFGMQVSTLQINYMNFVSEYFNSSILVNCISFNATVSIISSCKPPATPRCCNCTPINYNASASRFRLLQHQLSSTVR